jgi:hypothetical protein
VGDKMLAVLTTKTAQLFRLQDPVHPVPIGISLAAPGRTGAVLTTSDGTMLVTGGRTFAIAPDGLKKSEEFACDVVVNGVPHQGSSSGNFTAVHSGRAVVVLRVCEPHSTSGTDK